MITKGYSALKSSLEEKTPPELEDCQIFEETMNGYEVLRLVFNTKQEFLLPVQNLVEILGSPVDEDVDAVSNQPIGFMRFDDEDDDEEGTLH